MPKEIKLNGFALYSPSHQSLGLWRHPRDRSIDFNRLGHWVELARQLEAGLFDALFIADSTNIHDVYENSVATALRSAVQIPKHDPILLVSAMANATEHLGFGITGSVSYEPPYLFARRFSTLDHITDGRVAWNIVTNFSNAGARAVGLDAVKAHDTRYDVADEFLEVVYRLWEESWEDDALVADQATGVFTDPSKVHQISHKGTYFKVDAVHLVEPSPQRTPFLFQAGSSDKGRDFAARHAEAAFLADPSKAEIASAVADTRSRAIANGRDTDDIAFYALITVVVDHDEEAAKRKFEDYQRYADLEGSLAFLSGQTGIDLSKFDLDAPFPNRRNENAMTSLVDSIARSNTPSIREIALSNAIGGRGPVFVGSPTQVADLMEEWMDETGIDGFNLSYAVLPEGFTDFIMLVVPELQRRGRYKAAYAPGTLRQKLSGRSSAFLPLTHPGAQFRRN